MRTPVIAGSWPEMVTALSALIGCRFSPVSFVRAPMRKDGRWYAVVLL